MEHVLAPPSGERSDRPKALTFGKAKDLLWDSACEAFILTFLVLIFGSIALGLVSAVWRDMAPSLPPVVSGQPTLEAEPPAPQAFSFLRHHRFALTFGILFVGMTTGRLIKYSRNETHRHAAARLTRVFQRVSEQWFSLVVINAFVALVSVFVVQLLQQFSFTQFLWNIFADLVRALLQAIAGGLPAALVDFGEIMVGWYKANHFKFLFWLFYTAAICDDLGLPNYKALGRFLWHRFFKRKQPVVNPGS
jgi:uncharacterized integral membrane protein